MSVSCRFSIVSPLCQAQGIALIQVLIFSAALFGLILTSLAVTRSDQMITNNIINGTKAFWAASGGVEVGRNWVTENYPVTLPSTLSGSIPDGSYSVQISSYDPSSPDGRIRVTSTGLAPNNARKIVEEILKAPGFLSDQGLIQIDGFGTPTDMEDPGIIPGVASNPSPPGVRIPDWTIDARGHSAATGAVDPTCGTVPSMAGPIGNDNTDMPNELDKLRCKIVQRANECCSADGFTNSSICVDSPGLCEPGTCGAEGCVEGACSHDPCVKGTCADQSCVSGSCTVGTCSPGSCSGDDCAGGHCLIDACSAGTCTGSGCIEGKCTDPNAPGQCEVGACTPDDGPDCAPGTCPIGACQFGDCPANTSCTLATCALTGCNPGTCGAGPCVAGTCPVTGCTPGSCGGASGCVTGTCTLDCGPICPTGLCEADPGLAWVRGTGVDPRFATTGNYQTPNTRAPVPNCTDAGCTPCEDLNLGDAGLRSTGLGVLPSPPHDRGPLIEDTPDDTDDLPVRALTDPEVAALHEVIDEILDAALASTGTKSCITTGFNGGTHQFGTLSDPQIVIVSDPRDQNPKMRALSTSPPCTDGRVNNLVIKNGAVVEGAGLMILPRQLEVQDATFNWKGLILVLENGKIKIWPDSCGAVYGGVLLQTNPTRNNARLDFDKNLENPACGAPNNAFSINFACDAIDETIGSLIRSISWTEVFPTS